MARLTIKNLSKFKKDLLQIIIDSWESHTLEIQAELQEKIDAASEVIEPHSTFSKKEIVEQDARVILSGLNSPLASIKQVKTIPLQKSESIVDFSLFEVTDSEPGRTKTTIYFLLPLQSLERQKDTIGYEGNSIALTTRANVFYRHTINSSIKKIGGEIWEEPHMGHSVKTGKYTPDVTSRVTWIYREELE